MNTKAKNSAPKVTIVCITYNQENYIEQALKSFLMQKVNFDLEIIIADDASTDKTQKVITSYADKYPELFSLILRESNVGIQNNMVDALNHAKGDFIALCEGDDFWTDENKLQKQYDFMSKNAEYALCFHPVEVFYENNERKSEVYSKDLPDEKLTTDNLLAENFIQTNSVMYRRRDYKNIPTNILPMDWYLHLFHAKRGKIGFINQTMGAYRRHSGGVWWDSYKDIDQIWTRRGLEHYALYCEMDKLFKGEADAHELIRPHIYRTLGILIDTDRKYNTRLVNDALAAYPHSVEPLTSVLSKNVLELERIVADREDKIAHLNVAKHELVRIKSSTAWKILRTIKNLGRNKS